MKTIITIISFFVALTTSYAQNVSLSGDVYDATGQTVPFASAMIINPADTTAYKSAAADENGHFVIDNIRKGEYTFKILAMGYEEYVQPLLLQQDTALGKIVLSETAQLLDEVVVTAKQPVVRRKIDRLEFNVENSTLSSDNAWEILKKTPGVTVSSDALSIRGSRGILVTINDRKVYLTGTELKNLLENTDGGDVKSIEVITTPPARYEAQGSAVLNIKMKKNGVSGYKASVAGAYVQSTYPKGVMSTSQYYKNNKLSVYGGYMLGSGTYLNESEGVVRYFDNQGNVDSEWRSNTNAVFRSFSQNSYNLTAEYQLDSLNTIAVGGNGFSSLKSTANFDTPTYIYDGNGTLDSLFNTRVRRDYPQKNNSVNGSFEHKFSDKAKLVLSSDYTWHYFNQGQDVASEFSLPGDAPYRRERFLNEDSRRIKLFSAQADYAKTGEGQGMEAGLRYGKVDADSQLDFYNETAGVLVPNVGRSNRFLYDESVFAGYAGMDKEFGKWSFKAGLRGEYTLIKGNSVTTAAVNRQEYFKVFPTVYAMYKANDENQLGLSYGKRIIRPQYGWLNPFRTYASAYAYTTGDPGLQPAITHNISLLYTLKNKYNFDLYYRYENNPSMEISYQDYATNTLVTQVTNIDKNTSFGVDFNTNLQLVPWWQAGINANAGYFQNTFQGVDGGMYTNKSWNYSANANNRFTLTERKDLIAEANFYYRSPYVLGTYDFEDISSLSLSLRKTFFEGNAELTLIFSDIYKGTTQEFTTQYGNQYNYTSSYDDARSFRIQFRYRFGNQKLQGAKVKERTQEQQRL